MSTDPASSPSAPDASAAPAVQAAPSSARTALLLTPVVLALVVMAAHFLRFMVLPLVGLTLLLPLVLVLRQTWGVRVVQAWLVLGVAMWAGTTRTLIQQRQENGQPYLRLSIILGAVSLFTLVAALLLETPRLKRALRNGGRPR